MDEARGVCRGCGRTLAQIARWSSMDDTEREAIMNELARTGVEWYFDFVSPYSYIALRRLDAIPAPVAYRPVLLAALLDHWGQKGPAEIPAKRQWTYRWCTWWAAELGIPFRFPAAHPFNPLPYLRLAIACGTRPDAVRRIFEWLWTTGEDAQDPRRIARLCETLGVPETGLSQPAVKEELRKNTDEAARRGVFGVPSFVADGEVFWGVDSLEFLNAFLKDRAVVRNAEMQRVDSLPVAASRKA